MTTDAAVRRFRDIIRDSWVYLKAATEEAPERSLLEDWLQATWEIIVEGVVCEKDEFLEIYGDGADCNGASSRVWLPAALPTHRIECQGKSGAALRDVLTGHELPSRPLAVDRFVAWDGRQYEEAPPFDYVLVEHGDRDAVVQAEDIVFLKSHVEQ
jgi:hypothetical protein